MCVVKLYAVWVKIDESLPWIELEGTYQTKGKARKAAKDFLKTVKVKIVKVGVKQPLKAVATIKR